MLPVTIAAGGGATTRSSSTLSLFLSHISDTTPRSLTHRRPWSDLLDRRAFARPDTISKATSRLRKNAGYFRVNYLALLVATLAISLLYHSLSLSLLLALLAAWAACIILLTLLVVFLTFVGSLIISALMVGDALVYVHNTFYIPEDLFLDDQEPTGPADDFLVY